MTALPAVLMYHYVRPAPEHPGAGYRALDLETFEAQLDDIARHWTPVGWPDLLVALQGGGTLPDDAILLTFDDGLVDHHRWVLPRLVARGLPAIFFIGAREDGDPLTLGHGLHALIATLGAERTRAAVLDRLHPSDQARHRALEADRLAAAPEDPEDAWKRPLQRELVEPATAVVEALVEEHIGPSRDVAAATYLSRRQLTEIRDAGFALGGHGMRHPWLDALPRPHARSEITGTATWLERLMPGPWPFAYPFGGVPARPADLLRAAGFAAAFTTVPRHRGAFRLGRVDADDLGPEISREIGPTHR
jgi:peptidoglycan/xylan/chitin deacetylase (PgdA/CDA1 family)